MLEEILFYVGITAISIVVYFIGNFLFGARNEGGKRTLIAMVGISSGVLGYFMAKYYLENLVSHWLFITIGIVLLGFGAYLFLAALFASQTYI